MQKKQRVKTLVVYLELAALAMLLVFPVFWMLSISLRENLEVFSVPPKLWPGTVTIEPYIKVLVTNRYLRYFMNSYVISLAVSVISCVLGIIAGYGFSRFAFKGSKLCSMIIVATQTIPRVTLLIPYFVLLVTFKLFNTYTGLILTFTSFCLPYAVLMMTGYINTISKEIDEAVIMDGGTRFMALWRILVPVSLPGIVSTLTYTFILAWNEFLFALTLTRDDAMRTVPVGIAMLKGEQAYEWNMIMAFSILGSLPVLVIFLILQKYYVSGLTAGSVKG